MFDLGEAEGSFYIAMEFVDGANLRQIGQRVRDLGQIFPWTAAVQIGLQICEALEYAHNLTGLDGTLVLRHLSVYSLGTNTLFHRAGQHATSFASVQRASLAPLAEITPQVAGMIHDGLLPAQND